MTEGIAEVLTFAIGVAISPVPIIAVILMLFSGRAKINGPMFLVGWAVALGVLLAGVNPKNLLLAAGAGAALAGLGLPTSDAVVSLIVFVVVGSLTIGGPVVYYLLGGEAARTTLGSAERVGDVSASMCVDVRRMCTKPKVRRSSQRKRPCGQTGEERSGRGANRPRRTSCQTTFLSRQMATTRSSRCWQKTEAPPVPTPTDVMTVLVTLPPGSPGAAPHRHSGPAFGDPFALDAGVDPGIADHDGVTALQHAEQRGYDEIAALLRATPR